MTKRKPVYISEAAEMLGTTEPALRIRVHRMATNKIKRTIPMPSIEPWKGHGRWAWDRKELCAYIRAKNKLEESLTSGLR
jgi:hypothetical protein